MPSKKHIAGDKINGDHSSVTGPAYKLVLFLQLQADVTRISTGGITPLKGRRRTAKPAVKTTPRTGGIKLDVTNKTGVQHMNINIVAGSCDRVLNSIESWVHEQGFDYRTQKGS
jgi:hypothetical protein